MTDADRAFEAAEEVVAKAIADGSIKLKLSGDDFNALEVLPESISDLTELTELDLANTQISNMSIFEELSNLTELNLHNSKVSDLTSIAGLGSLKGLYLGRTQVSDLAPLAKLINLHALALGNTRVADISALSELRELQRLYLQNTLVSDVSPITGLKLIQSLDLSGTKIVDLRPVSKLSMLAYAPRFQGLEFLSCSATDLDHLISQIAEENDPKTRARTLFNYLETWEPPAASGDIAPPPDEVFPVDVQDERLEVAASSPTEVEQEEALKQSMHGALKDLADRLAKASGNHFPDLANAARRLEALLDCPFEDLDLPQVFLALSDFRSAMASGEEEGHRFPDKVVSLLNQIMEAGPALTVDNPDVNRMMERARRYRDDPDPDQDRDAQNAMSHAVVNDEDAIGEGLRRLEKQVEGRDDPESIVAQKAVNRNVLWRIAVGALKISGTISVGIISGTIVYAHGAAISEFAAANWAVLKQAAATYGPVFSEWFIASVSKLKEVAAVIASSERRPK